MFITEDMLPIVSEYLGDDISWTPEVVESALGAEIAAQASVVRFPANVSGEGPAALIEALCRRVAHNLALRSLPLGLQISMSEMAATQTRVGGTDAEVRRLESPYRRLVVG